MFIRLDAIGDFLIVLPYFKEIKKDYNNSDNYLILVGNKLWKDLGEYFLKDIFDQFIWIDRKDYKNNLFYRVRLNLNLLRINAGEVIDSTYSRDYIYNDSITRAISANIKIGWVGDNSGFFTILSRISEKWYTELVSNINSQLETEKHSHFFNYVLKKNINPNFKIYAKVGDILKYNLPEKYCVIAPSAFWSGKEWETNKFAECADYINQKHNYAIVLIGSSSEHHKYDEIRKFAKSSYFINCIGKTNLLDMIEVIRNADLLITNDTSAVHVAALTDTNAICIIGGGHFGRFVPNHSIKNIKWLYSKMECFGCNWKCIYDIEKNQTVPCIANIKSVEIFGVIDDFLSCK